MNTTTGPEPAVPPQAITKREDAFSDWLMNTVVPGPEDALHEAFCAGWEAAAPHLEAAAPDQVRVMVELLEEARFLLGERMPADGNGWTGWDSKTQAFLIGFRSHLRQGGEGGGT